MRRSTGGRLIAYPPYVPERRRLPWWAGMAGEIGAFALLALVGLIVTGAR